MSSLELRERGHHQVSPDEGCFVVSVFSPDIPFRESVFRALPARSRRSSQGIFMTSLASVLFVVLCLFAYATYLRPAIGGAVVGAVAIASLGFIGLLIAPVPAFAGYWLQMHYR